MIPEEGSVAFGGTASWNVKEWSGASDEFAIHNQTLIATAPYLSMVAAGDYPHGDLLTTAWEVDFAATSGTQIVNYNVATNLINAATVTVTAAYVAADIVATNASYVSMTGVVQAATNLCFQKTGGNISGAVTMESTLATTGQVTVLNGTNVLNESDTVLAGTGMTKSGGFDDDDLTISLDQDYTDARYVQSSTNIFDEVAIANDQFLGSELTTNGSFDANANGWTLTNAVWSAFGSGTILINAGQTNSWISSSNQLGGKVGDVYSITYGKTTANSDEIITLYYGGRTYVGVPGISQTITNTIGSTESNTSLSVWIQATTNTVYLDDISVKKITEGDLYVADDAHFSDTVYIGGIGVQEWPGLALKRYANAAAVSGSTQVWSSDAVTNLVTNITARINTTDYTVTDSNMTITSTSAGTNSIAFAGSFAASGSAIFEIHLFTNGVEVPDYGVTRKIGTGGDQGSFSAPPFFLNLHSGDVLDWRLWHDNGASRTVTWDHLGWTIEHK